MSAVLFFIAAAGVIAGAVGVVVLRDPFYCVLALVAHLLSLAVLFLLLRAEFVAAVQVLVYAGAARARPRRPRRQAAGSTRPRTGAGTW